MSKILVDNINIYTREKEQQFFFNKAVCSFTSITTTSFIMSKNFSSITDTATGVSMLTLSNAFKTIKYAFGCSGQKSSSPVAEYSPNIGFSYMGTQTFNIVTYDNDTNNVSDCVEISITITL